MPVTYLDLAVIAIILVSALLAMLRGFTREILAIASWAVAAVAAYAFYPLVLPYAKQYIANNNAALVVSAGAIFLLTLIVAYFVTAKLSDVILDSRIGALDRTLGFLFGAARGFLLVVIAFVFLDWLIADRTRRPPWIREAKSLNILESSGAWVRSLLPDDPEGLLQQFKKPGLDGVTPQETVPTPNDPARKTDLAPPSRPQNTAAQPGYQPVERQGLQKLIDTSNQPKPKPQ